MSTFFGLLGMFGFFVSLVIFLIQIFRKKSKRTPLLAMAIFFTSFVVGFSIPTEKTEGGGTAASPPSVLDGQSGTEIHPDAKPDLGDEFYNSENVGDKTLDPTDYGEELTSELTALGFTIDESTEMSGLFLQMGIRSLSSIQCGVGSGIDELQSFVAIANRNQDQKFYFTVENREMFYAGFMDKDLYDSENGGILNDINDIHIPETDVDIETYETLCGMAESVIKGQLNYPGTADFSMLGWGVGRSDDKYKIIGCVTAENGIGAEREVEFAVWFTEADGSFSVEGVAMDGTLVK